MAVLTKVTEKGLVSSCTSRGESRDARKSTTTRSLATQRYRDQTRKGKSSLSSDDSVDLGTRFQSMAMRTPASRAATA
eukprot:scaffold9394_cov124-Isochrysis_galbana.AAC.5